MIGGLLSSSILNIRGFINRQLAVNCLFIAIYYVLRLELKFGEVNCFISKNILSYPSTFEKMNFNPFINALILLLSRSDQGFA